MINHEKKTQKEAHQIHPSHKHDGLSSFKISFANPLEKKHFIDAIKSVPSSVFRIKGIVEFRDEDKPMLFQYVGGRFELSEYNNPKMRDRFLTLIGQNIEKESINAIFDKHILKDLNHCNEIV